MQETEQTQEQQDTARELAGKIMVYARDELMISMRFLDRALFRMPLIAADSVAAFGVDGETMYYNPEYVLHAFKKKKCMYQGIFTYDLSLYLQPSFPV